MTITDSLRNLPDLNQLYAKKRMRTQRLARLKELSEHNQLTQSFGKSVIETEMELIKNVEWEIETTHQNINDLADEWSSKILEFMGDGE